MSSDAIIVRGVGKRFRAKQAGRPTTLKARLFNSYRQQPSESFWGLRNVSFNVPKGSAVGVVGLNGAGKSTLLRLIGGVGKPDEGSIAVRGRIGALLDIGAGLTEDLSGRENVYLLGVIAGMLRAEVEARFEAIVAFAELEAAIEAPIRTYSTGMKMRLAFSVAVHTAPDVLLIDEVLAVGDLAFQRKCIRRIKEIQQSGCTIFLVSHDPDQITTLCDHALYLQAGHLVGYGPTEEIMALYEASVNAREAAPEPALAETTRSHRALQENVTRYGTGELQIEAVRLLGADGRPTSTIAAGESLEIQFDFQAGTVDREPIALVGIYDSADAVCFETNSEIAALSPGELDAGKGASLRLDRVDLAPGDYHVTVGLFSADWQTVYDYHAEVYPLRITGSGPSKGHLNPPHEWRVLQSRPLRSSHAG